MRTESVLVTGAAGFIGSHVCEFLLQRGDRVVGLDSFDNNYDPIIKRKNIRDISRLGDFSLVQGDIRSIEDLDRAFEAGPFTAIVHLAARPGVRHSVIDPLLYQDVNISGTTRLLEAARRHGVANFLFASSSSVYGASSKSPFREEDAADEPLSVYAASKRAGELTCHAYHHLYGLDVTCLRLFTVYGPRQRPDMAIHRFTRQIDRGETVILYGDGSSARDYTYVTDIVAGVVTALDRPAGYRVLNLGTTRLVVLRDLAQMIADRLGRQLIVESLEEQSSDVPLTQADISNAAEQLGYQATVAMEVGLDCFIDWYHHRAR
jgi:UDP-glucuronate 4-epimerase